MATDAAEIARIQEAFRQARAGERIVPEASLREFPDASIDAALPDSQVLASIDARLERLVQEARPSTFAWSMSATTSGEGGLYADADTYSLPAECDSFSVVFDDAYGGYFQVANSIYGKWQLLEELKRGPGARGKPMKIRYIRVRAINDLVGQAAYTISALGQAEI